MRDIPGMEMIWLAAALQPYEDLVVVGKKEVPAVSVCLAEGLKVGLNSLSTCSEYQPTRMMLTISCLPRSTKPSLPSLPPKPSSATCSSRRAARKSVSSCNILPYDPGADPSSGQLRGRSLLGASVPAPTVALRGMMQQKKSCSDGGPLCER